MLSAYVDRGGQNHIFHSGPGNVYEFKPAWLMILNKLILSCDISEVLYSDVGASAQYCLSVSVPSNHPLKNETAGSKTLLRSAKNKSSRLKIQKQHSTFPSFLLSMLS